MAGIFKRVLLTSLFSVINLPVQHERHIKYISIGGSRLRVGKTIFGALCRRDWCSVLFK